MNWSALAAIVSMITLISVVFGVFYAGGKLAQQVADHARELVDHDRRLDGHDAKHTSHEIAIAKLEEWHSGYRAGAAATGSADRDR